jgi:hypothetical protein
MNEDKFKGVGGSYVKIDGKRVPAAEVAKQAAASAVKGAADDTDAKAKAAKKTTSGSDA